MNSNGISSKKEIFILRLAFNYQYQEVGDKIRLFFKGNNFVKCCPYCNAERVEFKKTHGGKTITSHQLDHFFDKARYPLLCFSLYNLIPSDPTCNTINKSKLQFSDEYYLNPYIDGFGNSMRFYPCGLSTGYEVSEIKVEIDEHISPIKKKQLIGNNNEVNEDDPEEKGNINLFKLQSKYDITETRSHASRILCDINTMYKGMSGNKKFMFLMESLDSQCNYLAWYKKHICTFFNYSDFSEERYSKFNRDIHDHYFRLNKDKINTVVRSLIEANQN